MDTKPLKKTQLLVLAALSLPLLACTFVSWLSPSSANREITLTNEAVLATNRAVETQLMASLTAEAAQPATPNPASTRTAISTHPGDADPTLDLHLQITDGQEPVEATIRLYWPDTGDERVIDPTSDVVLPIPVDGATGISVTVTAPRFLTWSEILTLTESLELIVRLTEE
jgi:hypothetical protein